MGDDFIGFGYGSKVFYALLDLLFGTTTKEVIKPCFGISGADEPNSCEFLRKQRCFLTVLRNFRYVPTLRIQATYVGQHSCDKLPERYYNARSIIRFVRVQACGCKVERRIYKWRGGNNLAPSLSYLSDSDRAALNNNLIDLFTQMCFLYKRFTRRQVSSNGTTDYTTIL